MNHLRALQLSHTYQDISTLRYEHPEGGAYVYVRLLSLIRSVPTLITDKEGLLYVARLQERLNVALEHRFTGEQERLFLEAKEEVLRLLRAQLAVVVPLSESVIMF